MKFSFVENIFDDGIAELLIYDKIGQSYNSQTNQMEGISGNDIANEIKMLNDHPAVNEIHIRINSGGGSVIEGYSIFMAIKNSKKKTKTIIDGLGGSIAGIIFQAGDEREIVDFGRLMIHDPSIGVPSALMTDKQRNMIESFRGSLLTILNNNSKVNESRLSDIMSAETWFTSAEAIENGFADTEISTGRVFNEADTPDQIMAICNQLYFNNSKSKKMKDLKNHLGIDVNATEKEVLENVKTIQNDLTDAKNDINAKSEEIDTLKNEVSEVKNEAETLKADNDKLIGKMAEMHVNNAIAKGLFEESKKADLVEQCKNDMDGFVSIVESLKKVPTKVTNQINNGGSELPKLRELEKNNPKEVQRLMNEDKETYKLMYKEQYGVEPSNI